MLILEGDLRAGGAHHFNPRKVVDYGGFKLVEVETGASEGGILLSNVEVVRPFISLPGGRIDPRSTQWSTRRGRIPSLQPGKGGLYVVQFIGPVKREWLDELCATGVRVVGYVRQNAYLVFGDEVQLHRCRAWAATNEVVEWDGELDPGLKLHPTLKARAVASVGGTPASRLVEVQLFREALSSPSEADQLITALGGRRIQEFEFRAFKYQVCELPAHRVNDLTACHAVISVLPFEPPRKLDERQCMIVAGAVSNGIVTRAGYLAWLESLGFSQDRFDRSGIIVDITDSGVDNGTVAPDHFALYRFGEFTNGSRIAYVWFGGAHSNSPSTLAGCDGHGTLNAHIVAGYVGDELSFYPHVDVDGFKYDLGICPFVSVGSSVIFDPDYWTWPNLIDLVSTSYQFGARISNNSWGSSASGGAYTAYAQIYDALVRDAIPWASRNPVPGNQEFVVVFAAGNDGPSYWTICSPGTAKNVITVGASENVRSIRSESNPEGCERGSESPVCDTGADNCNEVAEFSSRGPCADGRKKPDLVAPGTHIVGGVIQTNRPSPFGVGEADPCFSASGVTALEGAETNWEARFYPPGQQFYTISSGTSHAAPVVAGACALLRQYFLNLGLPAPSPAMTKAYLINSARYLPNAGMATNLWSEEQGMGLVDLERMFDRVPRFIRDQHKVDVFTSTGQRRVFVGRVWDTNAPFRVTLAWTDAPGTVAGADALVNDLDLVVVVGGRVYRGNVFSGPYSVEGDEYDRCNNVESVFLPAGVSGDFIVIVQAANIAGDGVPNWGDKWDQDFALVVYNVGPVLGIEDIEFEEASHDSNGAIDPGEVATLKFVLKNYGTGSISNVVVNLENSPGLVSLGEPSPVLDLLAGEEYEYVCQALIVSDCGNNQSGVLRLKVGETMETALGFDIKVGKVVTNLFEFSNTDSIGGPDGWADGRPLLYPSCINVPVITGQLSRISVTLYRLVSERPQDLKLMLVAPDGRAVGLMSGAGGEIPVTNVTITLIDGGRDLPRLAELVSGFYAPTLWFEITNAVFPSPAPPGTNSSFQNLLGINPSGQWCLYVVGNPECTNDGILGGWSLALEVTNGVCSPVTSSWSDVSVEVRVSTNVVNPGDGFMSRITITNRGPGIASNLVLTVYVPTNLLVIGNGISVGRITNESSCLQWYIGELEAEGVAECQLTNLAVFSGFGNIVAKAVTASYEPFPGDNYAEVGVRVNYVPRLVGVPEFLPCDVTGGDISARVEDQDDGPTNIVLAVYSTNPNVIDTNNLSLMKYETGEVYVSFFPYTDGSTEFQFVLSDGFVVVTNSIFVRVYPHNIQPQIWIPTWQVACHALSPITIPIGWSDENIESNHFPRQSLTFWLSNAPPGMGIDSTNSSIFWIPREGDVGTYEVTVFVSDGGWEGWDSLTNSTAFSVEVRPRPRLRVEFSPQNSGFHIEWDSIPGLDYTVEWSPDPNGPWHVLNDGFGNPMILTAQSDTTRVWAPLPSSGMAFFRIRVGVGDFE